jgi:hypothetical protein
VISVRRYLVVANQTLGGPRLADKLRECMSAGPCRFYLVVPATPTSQFLEPISQPLSLAAVDGGGGMLPDYRKIAAVVARGRLDKELARLREDGAEADGEVGDRDPVMAVRDALRGREVDEVIVSTLPKGMSRWLGEDVPSRLRDSVPVPVTVVTQEDASPT